MQDKKSRIKELHTKYGDSCQYWDEGCPECLLHWNNRCEGNPYKCKKLYYQYLASSKKIDDKIVDFFENLK